MSKRDKIVPLAKLDTKMFLTKLAARTWQDESVIIRVLNVFTEMLGTMRPGEGLSTPMGTFYCVELKARSQFWVGSGKTWQIPARIHVKLKPSHRLKWLPADSPALKDPSKARRKRTGKSS